MTNQKLSGSTEQSAIDNCEILIEGIQAALNVLPGKPNPAPWDDRQRLINIARGILQTTLQEVQS